MIGGGLINGIGLSGKWPMQELAAIIAEDKDLKSAWQRTLAQAAVMADDESVSTGTRYDALRMVAMLEWSTAEPLLTRYLQNGVHAELQMGAISGISDIQDDAVAELLIRGCANFSTANRSLALDALLRTDSRCIALLDAVANSKLQPELLQDQQVKWLRQHSSEKVSTRARQVLK